MHDDKFDAGAAYLDPATRLWEQFGQANRARLAVLERAAAAAGEGSLHEDLRREAEREAHRLAGSLGVFGSAEGARLARLAEQLLADPASDALRAIVPQLRQELERFLAEPLPDQISTALSAASGPAAPGPTSVPPPAETVAARILVADDDPSIARLLERALQRAGYAVTVARDGAEAVRLAEAERFDLILLDFMMPKLNGPGACRAMRTDVGQADVPIVMLTARGDEHSVAAAFAAGATDYMIKPFEVTEVRARVRSWLAAARDSSA